MADLSHLTPAGAQLPGNYDVELYLNGTWLAERKLKFVPVDSLESSHAALPPGGGCS
ncbi:FimD/PapC N-terminal domain-containing protein [Klebsiella oxytoca]|uniref:FimD/PapC N-terminal domain-containing protein n=1 Tax=Klebsiella oxytoca TaxID=571 RepID=UPI0038515DD7